jgi:hypothetical protein
MRELDFVQWFMTTNSPEEVAQFATGLRNVNIGFRNYLEFRATLLINENLAPGERGVIPPAWPKPYPPPPLASVSEDEFRRIYIESVLLVAEFAPEFRSDRDPVEHEEDVLDIAGYSNTHPELLAEIRAELALLSSPVLGATS